MINSGLSINQAKISLCKDISARQENQDSIQCEEYGIDIFYFCGRIVLYIAEISLECLFNDTYFFRTE